MPDYRRYRLPGGTYFFTVNLLQRYPNDLLVRHIDILRAVVRAVREKRPFVIDAWVVLPDHLHCVWTLPPGDDDFANRWRLIKQGFSKALPITERRSAVRMARGERRIIGVRVKINRNICGQPDGVCNPVGRVSRMVLKIAGVSKRSVRVTISAPLGVRRAIVLPATSFGSQ
jgi:putative transposase